MEYIRNTTDFRIMEETAVSLGKFDGVHKGHGRLMEYLAKKKKDGLKTVIFTFDIPPRQQTGGGRQGGVLTTNEEKRQIFLHHGIDYLVECPFTPEVMRMEPEAFVDWIAKSLCIKSLAVGTDFRFGYNRRGDCSLLQKLSDAYGYDLAVVGKVRRAGRDISSTWIREEIAAGRMESANGLLGYCYFMQGAVVHGKEIGRTIGVPTANLLLPGEKLLPPSGVYVTRTSIRNCPGQAFGGITNVGCKPTVGGANPIGAETHLFGFRGQLYGEEAKVEFLSFVRPEQKFETLDALKQQIQKDIVAGMKYYSS